MRVEFPLLSVLSTAALIGALIFGADVSLYDVRAHVETTESGFSVSVHPTWLCWMDTRDLFRGLCYGNVMICDESLPSELHRTEMVAHEAAHLEQWCALGPWLWLAQSANLLSSGTLDILPLEPEYRDINDPSVGIAQMWMPPNGWLDQWGFLRISIDRDTANNAVHLYADALHGTSPFIDRSSI